MSIDRGSTRWLGALTVTAAAALLAPPASASTRPAAAMPPPVASWHGHPIRQPEPRRQTASANGPAQAGGAQAVLRQGTGYGHPGGSTRVRAVQRMLHRLGYQCGPVDGLYGPLTAASVRWFQIKHGFPPTGALDGPTLNLMRLRIAHGAPASSTAASVQATSASPAQPSAPRHPPAPTPAAAVPQPHHGSDVWTPILASTAGVLALLMIAAWLYRRRRLRAVDQPPQPAAPEPDGPLVVGYAVGATKRELDRQAATIEQACAEREWKLAGVVREGSDESRPGLSHALERAAAAAEGRLVVARLDQVAQSPPQLAILLAACAEHGVDLAAVDPDLDTATPEGRLAARTLLGPGRPTPSRRRRARRPAPTAEIGR